MIHLTLFVGYFFATSAFGQPCQRASMREYLEISHAAPYEMCWRPTDCQPVTPVPWASFTRSPINPDDPLYLNYTIEDEVPVQYQLDIVEAAKQWSNVQGSGVFNGADFELREIPWNSATMSQCDIGRPTGQGFDAFDIDIAFVWHDPSVPECSGQVRWQDGSTILTAERTRLPTLSPVT